MDRFWKHVQKTGENDCWPWIGAKTRKGYGVFRISKKPSKMAQAHRIAHLLAIGDPGELHVLHSCDNPCCCNPKHLRAGTNSDNVADRVSRKRSGGGGQYHKNKNPPRNEKGQYKRIE